MDEAGDDVGLLQIEVVMWPKDIGGDDRRELASVLLIVALVHHVDHALGVRVAVV